MIIYLIFILASLVFFAPQRDRLFCLSVPFVLLVDLILWELYPIRSDYVFFYSRAIYDCILLLLCYVCTSTIKFKRDIVAVCATISLCVNVYLCVDQTSNFIYHHWELINFLLCEVIIITLYLESIKMLTSIKKYLYIGLGFVGLALFGWVKLINRKNKQLQQELQTERNNTIVLNKQREQSKEIEQYLAEAKAEADEVAHENNEKRIKKVRPNVGDVFGDKRL